ncbi:hypothetical protein DRW03_26750 [Corallococcus sp. H22C18031201]|uniref:hypothetical protein n=1 Tax=Citreicoccus inhibens TaxID=2849499 RepID=UPI000E71BDB3|nr:hypothetical protein [Citreicoccus inhibens]MBU8894745.1 hypothetical protein [Citreicoccus inhibens]RJS17600.1 hypothetical protein DRW03_26750 [Corallococcus sp. H22C18031201]
MRLSASSAVAATVLMLSSAGCVKEITSDERLDRDTKNLSVKETPGAAELQKLSCDDTSEALNKARNVNRPETDRLVDYIQLYSSLRKRTATFEEAMNRNPDLSYREGSQSIVAAKEACVQQSADVRVEFETYLRELIEVPTVQEIKGGNTVTVARLDFNTLRQAIETLEPDDKDQLVGKVNGAEKKVSGTTAPASDEAASGKERRRK